MARRLSEAGYSTKIMFTNNRVETVGDGCCDSFYPEGSRDPLLIEPAHERAAESEFRLLPEAAGSGDPDSLLPELLSGAVGIPHVSMDDRAVGRAAAEYLLRQGHARIGGISKA